LLALPVYGITVIITKSADEEAVDVLLPPIKPIVVA